MSASESYMLAVHDHVSRFRIRTEALRLKMENSLLAFKLEQSQKVRGFSVCSSRMVTVLHIGAP
jgi:hypothetical protein